jgi:hypothetical protein
LLFSKVIKMDYTNWIQRLINSNDPKNLNFAREALGPARFELLKSGKLQIDQLYCSGKVRTIKELKELMR